MSSIACILQGLKELEQVDMKITRRKDPQEHDMPMKQDEQDDAVEDEAQSAQWTVNLSSKQWDDCRPTLREPHKLKTGWTHIFNRALMDVDPRCCLNFLQNL